MRQKKSEVYHLFDNTFNFDKNKKTRNISLKKDPFSQSTTALPSNDTGDVVLLNNQEDEYG